MIIIAQIGKREVSRKVFGIVADEKEMLQWEVDTVRSLNNPYFPVKVNFVKLSQDHRLLAKKYLRK